MIAYLKSNFLQEPAEKQVPEKKESKIEKHLESKIKEMVTKFALAFSSRILFGSR